jgi:hypothetical protein
VSNWPRYYGNPHQFGEKCSKNYKNACLCLKNYSMTNIIKTMNLAINFSPFMLHDGSFEHLAMFYSNMNYINHTMVLFNSMQPKSQFTQFAKNDFKTLIEQLNLK